MLSAIKIDMTGLSQSGECLASRQAAHAVSYGVKVIFLDLYLIMHHEVVEVLMSPVPAIRKNATNRNAGNCILMVSSSYAQKIVSTLQFIVAKYFVQICSAVAK